MTVSSSTAKVSYSGNGSTQAFAVPFYFLANSQLLVVLRSSAGVETTQVLGTNYTVTGAGVLTGGTVTMTVAPASGTTLVISRNVPLTQETDLQPNDRLPAETLEQSIDKLTMITQQIDEATDRTLKYPLTDSSSISSTLPTSSERAGKYLAFSNTGAPIVEGIPPGAANVRTFGATGDGTTDDTAAVQAAVTASDAVYFPAGTYKLTSAVTLKSNNTLFGEGASSILLYTGTAGGQGALFANSGSSSSYVENITISDLKVLGQVGSLGFSEFVHLISLNGVRNAVVERCVVEGFRGDGIYIGSGDLAGQERHNINVTVRDCYINGVNNDNRNGISIIDGSGVNIDNNYFVNTTRSNMPGAIDVEPDVNVYHIIRDISIRNNRMISCGGNVGNVSIFLPSASFTTMPNGFNIENNYIQSSTNAYGIYFTYGNSSGPALTESTAEFGIRISKNVVNYGSVTGRGFGLGNANDAVLDGNQFIGGTTSFIGGTGVNVLDITLRNNMFVDVQYGVDPFAVAVYTGSRIKFESNIFKDCGPAVGALGGGIEFASGTTSYVDIIGNIFVSPSGSFTQQAIRDSAHTFTGATNRLIGNSLIAGANNFVASINLNNYPVSIYNNIPSLGVNAVPSAYRLSVDGAATNAALFDTDDTNVQITSTNGTVNQAVGYAIGGFSYSGTLNNNPWGVVTNNTPRMQVDIYNNIIVTNASRATNATDGFLYLPSCAGTPTGTPRTYTDAVPLIVDRTNNKLYFYSGGAWRDAGP